MFWVFVLTDLNLRERQPQAGFCKGFEKPSVHLLKMFAHFLSTVSLDVVTWQDCVGNRQSTIMKQDKNPTNSFFSNNMYIHSSVFPLHKKRLCVTICSNLTRSFKMRLSPSLLVADLWGLFYRCWTVVFSVKYSSWVFRGSREDVTLCMLSSDSSQCLSLL